MATGKIKVWKGRFGFIKDDDGGDVFVHISNIQKSDQNSLDVNLAVEFKKVPSKKFPNDPSKFDAYEVCLKKETIGESHHPQGNPASSAAHGTQPHAEHEQQTNGGSEEDTSSTTRKHLILTVGTNALPIWVAWYHLKEELNNPKVAFVWTKETKETVGCLKEYFKCDGAEDADFLEISETKPGDPKAVRGTIEDFFNRENLPENTSIHVHYTGGTQVMGVETVLAVAKEKGYDLERSYLNARSGSAPTIVKQDGKPMNPKDARQGICPDIKRIAELNGFNLSGNLKTQIPNKPHMEAGSKIWLQCAAWNALENSLKEIAESDESRKNYKVFADVNIKPREGKSHFKLDVVAVLGYQVIVVSCSGSSKTQKGDVKPDAIRAYHQAKQLGGDEARAIVLCGLSENLSQKLQNDLHNDIGSEDVPLQIWGKNTWDKLNDQFGNYLQDLRWKGNSGETETSEETSAECEQETQTDSQTTNSQHQVESSTGTNASQDHLVFTVGTNALPIWVAWKYLKTKLKNPKASFVYTKETQKTVGRLKCYFKCDGATDFACILVEDPGNPEVVSTAIEEGLLNGLQTNDFVHVHYTGGTQVMGVETVLAVAKEKGYNLERSYLNARSGSVPTIVDQDGNAIGTEDARQKICPDIKKIAELNGFEVSGKNFGNFDIEDPQDFASDSLNEEDRETLRMASAIPELLKTDKEAATEKQGCFSPPGIWLEYAALAALKNALKEIKCARKNCVYSRDNYALYRGVHVRKKVNSSKPAAPFELEPFELDVVAVLGYQVVVISCTTTEEKKTVREKAMEAYHRAKQLGGDEARAIMLCHLEDDKMQDLEKELKDDTGSKDVPLQVWGKTTWTGLSRKFGEYLGDLKWQQID